MAAVITINVLDPLTKIHASVFRDEHWRDLLNITEGDAVYSMVGQGIEIFIGPSFDYDGYFIKLSTASGQVPAVVAAAGEMSIRVDRETVRYYLPAGRWAWIGRIEDGAGGYRELWRGELTVHDGNTATS